MQKLIFVVVFILGITTQAFAKYEIVRQVDDFSGLEMVRFNKPLQFESEGLLVPTMELSPEAAINPDGSIAWLRWSFKRNDSHSWLGVSKVWKSKLKLKLGSGEIVEFSAINELSEADIAQNRRRLGGKYVEYALFGLTLDQLKKIANTDTISNARLYGGDNKYVNVPRDQDHKIGILGGTKFWLYEVNRFYKAIIGKLNE